MSRVATARRYYTPARTVRTKRISGLGQDEFGDWSDYYSGSDTWFPDYSDYSPQDLAVLAYASDPYGSYSYNPYDPSYWPDTSSSPDLSSLFSQYDSSQWPTYGGDVAPTPDISSLTYDYSGWDTSQLPIYGGDVAPAPDTSSLTSDYSSYPDPYAGVVPTEDPYANLQPWSSPIGPLSTGEQEVAQNNPDFTLDQLANVVNDHESGRLSDSGYNQIISGNVTSGNLQDFLDADPGAPEVATPGSTTGTKKDTANKPQKPAAVAPTGGGSGFSTGGGGGGGSKSGSGSAQQQQQSQTSALQQLLQWLGLSKSSTTAATTTAAKTSAAPVISTASTTDIGAELTAQTLISGVPNWVVGVGALVAVSAVARMLDRRGK